MNFEISELAEEDLDTTASYLLKKWGPAPVNKFLDRIDEAVLAVCENPTTYLEIDADRHIYKFVVNKHVTLYYKRNNRIPDYFLAE